MAGETVITIIGNLTADPELRFTQTGAPVADFTVASTPSTYDKTTNQWKDGETLFMRCSVWREMAENVAESLRKGMRVIVQGRLHQRSYETREGERRTVVELQVDEVGPSLRKARAQVTRTTQPQQGGYPQQQQSGWQQAPAGGNAWAAQQAAAQAPAGGQAGDQWSTQPQQQGMFEGTYAQQAQQPSGNTAPPF